uniref:Uncharacterized protein n=1 Tax=Florenciella parvula TaxID=236787 RepID=A0A7S2FQF3_9STRA|mmetsp:Transcript_21009/g.43986  ORF Transcript_21009/g.43986 Transcript_21009/m.43986 type:complete len:473 (+) Transcript_21009:180-1598(+)
MSRFGFLLAATLVTSNAGLLGAVDPSSALEESVLRTQFEKFVADFNRVYKDDDEVAERYEIFKSNIELIAVRNAAEAAAGSTGTHGVTKFADLTQEEFASRYLKTITPEDLAASKAQPGMFEAEATNNSSNSRLRGRQLLATYDQDWTGVYTTAVKNQGYCGSCWAFSVVEQVESDSMRLLGENDDFILSPQELVSCDTSNGNAGCNGGWTTTAYDYIESSGGLVQETAYPYVSGATGTQYSCDTDAILNPLVTVTDYYQYYTESAMAQHVGQVGTLSIAIDASTWASYTSGVMSTCGTSIDHAVQITGVNTDSSNSMGDAYWLVRNSWGTDWGYSGYIYLSYGDNTCGITTIPTYTEVKLTGGTSVPTAAPTAGSGISNTIKNLLREIEDATGLDEQYVVMILVFLIVFVICSCISCCCRQTRPRRQPPVRHVQNPVHQNYGEYPATQGQATLVYTPIQPSAPPASGPYSA